LSVEIGLQYVGGNRVAMANGNAWKKNREIPT